MAISETLKGLTNKAREQAAEHKDDLKKAIDKAQDAADKRTGGKYHDKLEKAGRTADRYLDELQPDGERAEKSAESESGSNSDTEVK
ncbi:MAG: antitoxin [Actinobacteria bacterium]|nr:antitoxin [Actinomycetota bacterium]